MKKKILSRIAIGTFMLIAVVYIILKLSGSMIGTPNKGIVSNPSPDSRKLDTCETSTIVEIKCYRLWHYFTGRKHFAYNKPPICLEKDQRIEIEHLDKAETEDGFRIEATVLGVIE